ncbi:hypothetical protein BDZ45DRAFT_740916 [Acephala macrosclerotiorum]|nr:hypothetical protein BDZ45DRAFT_740916 [Acephala macrosclerotiorum]
MASPSPSAPSRPEDSVEPINDPTSPNPKDTSQNSQAIALGTMTSFKARILASRASRQGMPSTRPLAHHGGNGVEVPPGWPNPGGRIMLAQPPSSVGARDNPKQTPTGDESGNPRDVTAQSGSLPEPRTGTKRGKDKGEAMDSGSRVTGMRVLRMRSRWRTGWKWEAYIALMLGEALGKKVEIRAAISLGMGFPFLRVMRWW